MYALGNPILLTDPSGQRPIEPFWISGEPIQINGDVTKVPVWWEETPYGTRRRQLEFEPQMTLQPAVTGAGEILTGQTSVPGYPCVEYETEEIDPKTGEPIKKKEFCGLCGTVTIASIYQTLFGSDAMSVEAMVAELNELVGREVAASSAVGFGALQELAETVGLTVWEGRSANEFRSADEYFEQEIRPNLNGSRWPIILVNVDGGTGEIGRGTSPHFIAIDGLSSRTDWNRGEEWQWVRIFNPLLNRTEYYRTADNQKRNLKGVWTSQLDGHTGTTIWVGPGE
jgi:hypothetical protein